MLSRPSPGSLFRRLGLALLVAIAGVVAVGSPLGRGWEEDLGLSLLFRLRGPIAPPGEVAIVSVDRESADRLGLPSDTRKWPRDLHGRLLDRLTAAGASVVAFDVMFQEPRDSARDQAFAKSVRRAGNVILFEFLKKDILPIVPGGAGDAQQVVMERRIEPIPALADAALGLAPFALPRVPIKVSQVWLFKSGAGGAPTLPIVTLGAHILIADGAVPPLLRKLDPVVYGYLALNSADTEGPMRVDHQVGRLRRLFQEESTRAPRVLGLLAAPGVGGVPRKPRIAALIEALDGPSSIHLNYYGPPGTIDTLSYHRVITGKPPRDLDLSGRAVFVGAAARLQPEQRDGFYTPYTLPSGLDVSGVEIAATAFANLLERNRIKPLAPVWEMSVVIVWGLSLGFALRRFSGGWIPWIGIGLGGAYFSVAVVAFVQAYLWMPLVTPSLVQLPLAMFGALFLRYRGAHEERENIRRAFGMHLPLPVVDQLARGIDDFRSSAEHAYGICLSTDAEQYTTLSERLEPGMLKQLMNDYYEAIFTPVRNRGGVVADVVGDAMLAIWAAECERPELRKTACETALEVLESVDGFNARNPEYRLPTRVGLHCGQLVLGHVGAVDHYEYRAVGDIVNTASRIEGLAKRLGVRLLVSEDVVGGLEGLRCRPLGRFLLKGKTRPLSIVELTPSQGLDESERGELWQRFATGLAAYRAGNWADAVQCFEAIEHEHGDDGPTGFYRRMCHRYLVDPPEGEWSGVTKLADK